MNSLDQVLKKPEVMDIWDRGTVMMCLGSEVVFRIEKNYDIIVDKIQLIDVDSAEFTDAIHKYNVTNIQTLDNLLIIDIIKKENDMKLRTQLSVLDPEIVVCIIDPNGSDLVVKVKDIPKKLKERSVNKLYRAYTDSLYDFSIFLKW